MLHLARMGRGRQHSNVPKQLKLLLESPSIMKSGVNIRGDVTKLKEVGVNVPVDSVEDTALLSKRLGIVKSGELQALAGVFLQVHADK